MLTLQIVLEIEQNSLGIPIQTQVPVNMRDDQETLMKLKREVTRLRLMKEGLSEETKEALAKAAAANNKKAEAEKEEEAESKKLQLEKQQK